MTTKIPAELSSTPGISDSSDATAITIASDEKVGIGETSPQFQMLTVKSSSATGNNLRLTTGSELATFVVNDSGDLLIHAHGADERIKFLNDVGSGTALAAFDSDGLKFGSDTAAANALDDYEEGTWSPTFAATGLSVTHDISNGYYTKIGNHVFFSMLIGTNAVSGTSSYHLTITGLPYTALNSAISMSSGSVGLSYKFVNNENGVKWFISANTSEIRFYDGSSNTGAITESNHLSTGTTSNRMYITGHYLTA